MTKAKKRTEGTPHGQEPVGRVEGKTLVINLHAASQGPHWLSGSRKPALHVAKVPPARDIDGNVKLALDMFRSLTGKEPTPADIDELYKSFKANAANPKPTPKRFRKGGRK